MTEKYIESRLRNEVKKLGGIAIKFLPISFNGLPDRIVLMPGGKLSFVELKRPGKVPSAIQFFVMAKLIKLGFKVLVINSIESLNEFIKSIKHDL